MPMSRSPCRGLGKAFLDGHGVSLRGIRPVRHSGGVLEAFGCRPNLRQGSAGRGAFVVAPGALPTDVQNTGRLSTFDNKSELRVPVAVVPLGVHNAA